jgi:NAD-dependent SIR2 family protein deacetylase
MDVSFCYVLGSIFLVLGSSMLVYGLVGMKYEQRRYALELELINERHKREREQLINAQARKRQEEFRASLEKFLDKWHVEKKYL